jgi:hypothetical protein
MTPRKRLRYREHSRMESLTRTEAKEMLTVDDYGAIRRAHRDRMPIKRFDFEDGMRELQAMPIVHGRGRGTLQQSQKCQEPFGWRLALSVELRECRCQATPKLTPQATLKLTPSWTLVKKGMWTTSTPIWLTCLTHRRTNRM